MAGGPQVEVLAEARGRRSFGASFVVCLFVCSSDMQNDAFEDEFLDLANGKDDQR